MRSLDARRDGNGMQGAIMKIWNVAAKVPSLEREITFIEAMGGRVLLDQSLQVDGDDVRVVLVKWADKYMHLFERAVYERRLDKPLQHGLCHVVFELGKDENLDELRQRALDAGARESMPKSFISSGFGTRDVVFMQSPGGILFELIKVYQHGVPELP